MLNLITWDNEDNVNNKPWEPVREISEVQYVVPTIYDVSTPYIRSSNHVIVDIYGTKIMHVNTPHSAAYKERYMLHAIDRHFGAKMNDEDKKYYRRKRNINFRILLHNFIFSQVSAFAEYNAVNIASYIADDSDNPDNIASIANKIKCSIQGIIGSRLEAEMDDLCFYYKDENRESEIDMDLYSHEEKFRSFELNSIPVILTDLYVAIESSVASYINENRVPKMLNADTKNDTDNINAFMDSVADLYEDYTNWINCWLIQLKPGIMKLYANALNYAYSYLCAHSLSKNEQSMKLKNDLEKFSNYGLITASLVDAVESGINSSYPEIQKKASYIYDLVEDMHNDNDKAIMPVMIADYQDYKIPSEFTDTKESK